MMTLRSDLLCALAIAGLFASGCDHPNWLVPTPQADAGSSEPDASPSEMMDGGAGDGGASPVDDAGGSDAATDAGSEPPRPVTAAVWTTSGGGDIVSADHRARLVIGGPLPVGTMQSADHQARFGAAATAAQSFP